MRFAGARDLAREIGIPPDVIGVDGDADAVAELVAEIVRLRERVHAGAVGGIHGMQRLDRQRHARLPRVGQERANASRTCDRAPARSRESLRQPSHHEDEALRADRGRLVNRAPIVVERGAPPGLVGGRKHAAAAQAGDGHAMRPDELRGALEPAA